MTCWRDCSVRCAKAFQKGKGLVRVEVQTIRFYELVKARIVVVALGAQRLRKYVLAAVVAEALFIVLRTIDGFLNGMGVAI
jgi:hypothetical protein